MRDFYISDPHFGHELVSRLRGFDTPAEHDQYLYEQWLHHLPSNEQLRLWILGDNHCGDQKAEEAAMDILANFRRDMHTRKNTTLELHGILGNHDSAYPTSARSHAHLHRFYTAYDSVQLAASTRIAGRRVMLSHCPYDGNTEANDPLEQFRLRDLGAPIIHGHTHSSEAVSFSDRGTLQICVCVEACPNFSPREKSELATLIIANS